MFIGKSPTKSILISPSKSTFFALSVRRRLGQRLGSVALVGSNSFAVHELVVGIRGPSLEAAVPINKGPGCEPILGAPLAAPVGAEGVGAAFDIGGGSLASGRPGDGVEALGDRSGLRVDAERDVARGVILVAGPGERLDRPFGDIRHRRDSARARVESRGSESRAGAGNKAEEDSVEVHVDDGGPVCV
jgi:hypothetical protein